MSEWDDIKKLGGIGILTIADTSRLKNQRGKVLHLMMDGCWHNAGDIIRASGGREGLRRLRELREIPNVSIVRRRCGNDFEYRLKYAPGIQNDLFSGQHFFREIDNE